MDWIRQIGNALAERVPLALSWRDALDIIIVTIVIYRLLLLTRKTRAFQVLKGIAIIFIAFQVVEIFDLKSRSWRLRYVIDAGAVILVVMFQPEIRRGLEQIGQGTIIEKSPNDRMDVELVIQNLMDAMLNLSRRRVGALIVLRQKTALEDVVETGSRIDSLVSSRLLENIFEPNTPLHDGAVVVDGDRIVAAACLLPLSENSNLPSELGTRHRAAIGISERSDAVVLIASEETGKISVARKGEIVRPLDAEKLRAVLTDLYNPQPKEGNPIYKLMRRRGMHEKK